MKHTFFALAVALTTLATGCQTAPKHLHACCAAKTGAATTTASCCASKTKAQCPTTKTTAQKTSCCASKAKKQ